MKTIIRLFMAAFLFVPCLAHADPFLEFENRIKNEFVKPFALDIGGLLGASAFRPGPSLGFPHFQVRGIAMVQTRVDKNNLVLRDAGVRGFGFPMAEIAMGLPYKFDVIFHGFTIERLSVFGGGIRYGIIEPDIVKVIPNLGVSVFVDKISYPSFKTEHFGLNVEATWSLPFVRPFLGVGYDNTKVTIGAVSPTNILTNVGVSGSAQGSRFLAGIDMTPFPFIRVTTSYLLNHGLPGAQLAFGARF